MKEKFDSGIIQTNNEVKDIIKLIKSLENRETLWQGTTTKITSQEGGFLNVLRLLMTPCLPLMKRVLTRLSKSALIPLWLSAGMSTENAAVQKKIYGWGTTALTISNEEIDDKMKIVKLLEESGLLIKWISKTIKNKAKERKGGFFPMLLQTLVASILGNALTGKGVMIAGQRFWCHLIF